jgi:c-di-GMP-binding flagellar brake protein YcgR
MDVDRSLSERERDALLTEACARNIPAEVVPADAEDKSSLRSRLLEAAAAMGAGLVIEAPTREGSRVMLHPEETINVVFMFGGQKFGFRTKVKRRSTMNLGGDVEVPALALAYPPKIYKLQRRRFFRVMIPSARPLVVECVARDRRREDGDDLVRFETVARDISSGGIAIKIPAPYLPLAQVGKRIALVFDLEGVRRTLRLLAEVRHVASRPGGDHIAGMQFVEWHKTLAGRKAVNSVTRYVVRRQRAELKKKSGLE